MTRNPAIFASAFHPHVGGVEELVRQLSKEQLRQGMRPLVVTNRHPATLEARTEVDGISVTRHPFRAPARKPAKLASWAIGAPRGHLDVLRELRAWEADLIHIQCVSHNASYALSASRILGLPLVVTMHGELSMDAARIYERSTWLRHVWRRSLDRASVITACSQYVLDEAEAAYGRSFDGRGFVIANGVRVDEFAGVAAARGARPYILGIGRMVEQKGFDVLIKAFANLAERYPHVDLVLAGDGPSRSAHSDLVDRLQLGQRVFFKGQVAHGEAIGLFAGAEVFALPSRHEPQGIVMLEAMAAGTPVVASDVGGVAELVDHEVNGLLFADGDVHALASALSRLLDDARLRERFVAAGRLSSEARDWGTVAQRYNDAYRQARA